MDEQPLSALRPGERATVDRVDGEGSVRRRLLELGLTPGTVVTLVRLAPLRDPLEIRVRGYQLCLRRSEADAVMVRPEPAAVPDASMTPAFAYARAGGAARRGAGPVRGFFRRRQR